MKNDFSFSEDEIAAVNYEIFNSFIATEASDDGIDDYDEDDEYDDIVDGTDEDDFDNDPDPAEDEDDDYDDIIDGTDPDTDDNFDNDPDPAEDEDDDYDDIVKESTAVDADIEAGLISADDDDDEDDDECDEDEDDEMPITPTEMYKNRLKKEQNEIVNNGKASTADFDDNDLDSDSFVDAFTDTDDLDDDFDEDDDDFDEDDDD